MAVHKYELLSDSKYWESAVSTVLQKRPAPKRDRPLSGGEITGILDHSPGGRTLATRFRAVAEDQSFSQVSFNGITLSGCRFYRCSFPNAQFIGCRLESCIFVRCDLRDANFTNAHCAKLVFEDCIVDAKTNLHNLTNPQYLALDRNTLLRLGEHRGGLSDYDLSLAELRDDVAELRAQFSGFRRWLNAGALIAFVAPYLIFLAWLWINTLYGKPGNAGDLTVVEALGRYIVNGGQNWAVDWCPAWWSITLLVLMGSYNVVRGVLFWKVDRLETRQRAFGVPPSFSFSDSVFRTWRENDAEREHAGPRDAIPAIDPPWPLNSKFLVWAECLRRRMSFLTWQHLIKTMTFGAFFAVLLAVFQLVGFGMRNVALP